MFINTPDSVAKAYRRGLFSCLKRAKASVLMLSKNMIAAIQVIYSGCWSRLAHSAMLFLNSKSIPVKRIVEPISETDRVLYNFF